MGKSQLIAILSLIISFSVSAESKPSFESLIRLMLKQEVNAFFVYENKATGKYFQFQKVDENNFEVDLPVISIDKTAMKRAESVFKKAGIEKKQVKSKDPQTNKEFKYYTFRGVFSINDIKNAEKLMSDVFTIVHLDSKKHYQAVLGWETPN
ncbi:MAG: hypothetical protein ACC657_06985 [Thiohalomonadales bacterium]